MTTKTNTQNELLNLYDFEKSAENKIDQNAWDYYAGGANDEITLQESQEAYRRLKIKYRVLVDISKRSMTTKVLGKEYRSPIFIAPTAFQQMAHPQGEIGTVRAAGKFGIPMILSTLATTSIEDVLDQANSPVWFQLYVYRDKEVTEQLVRRAEKAGCEALVLTVDSPLLGKREKDIRNRFNLPVQYKVANFSDALLSNLPSDTDNSGLSAYIASLYDQSLTWSDLSWFRSITGLPILVKGIVRSEDALLAIDHGANGIIVSNHGGRQLDTAPATIDVLPEIIETVQNKIDVLVDGGIRRGTDILKALALGAKAVLIGRPILWGLAVNGQEGVEDVLQILHDELDLAMALAGAPNIEAITKDLIC